MKPTALLVVSTWACATTTNDARRIADEGNRSAREAHHSPGDDTALVPLFRVDDTVWIVGSIDVPSDSRLALAEAAADAAAKSELVKWLRVQVVSCAEDRQTTTHQSSTLVTGEVASGVLGSLASPTRSHVLVNSVDGTPTLRVTSTFNVHRSILSTMLADVLHIGPGVAAALVDRISARPHVRPGLGGVTDEATRPHPR